MFVSSWWAWSTFVLVFLVTPMGYGWGYRGWGPPFPSYLQRQRATRASYASRSLYNHEAWGIGGDVLWMLILLGVLWAVMGVAWW